MDDDRLPIKLWIDAHLHQLTLKGIPFYIVNSGAYAAGTVMVKIVAVGTGCILLQQQRDLMTGELGWMALFKGETVAESEADEYIRRAIDRDPDLWVIEVEDRELSNPFEGKIF